MIRCGQKEYRYLQLVENQRINGRVKQKVIFTLGRVEKVAPVYHWTDERVRGHIAACVLGHWLERLMERKLRDGGYSESVSTALRELGVSRAWRWN